MAIRELSAERIPATVDFYAGYKGEETPRAVWIEGKEYPIEKILSRKRVFNIESEKTTESFEVLMEGLAFMLEESGQGEWTLSSPYKA